MMLTGRYETGLEAFKKVLEISPERTYTAPNIAHWSTVYGRYEEAMRWMIPLQDNDSNLPRATAALAQIYKNLGMSDKFRESMSRAQELSPEDTSLFDLAADFYFQAGDHAGLNDIAATEFEKIDPSASARYSPTNRTRYFWHGLVALLEGNYVQAASDMTEAAGGEEGIDAATYDEITRLKYIAYVYQKQGQVGAANALLSKCLTLAIDAQDQGWDTPTIHYRTAQIYSLQGDLDNAIKELQQAVDRGWLIAGLLEQDPLWAPMQEDVRFQAIAQQVNEALTIERDKVTALLALNDH